MILMDFPVRLLYAVAPVFTDTLILFQRIIINLEWETKWELSARCVRDTHCLEVAGRVVFVDLFQLYRSKSNNKLRIYIILCGRNIERRDAQWAVHGVRRCMR